MRLIDADVLDRGLKNFLALMPDEKHPEAHMAFEMILERMERIPTIAPESLGPKGRWKYYHKKNIAVCTNCSFERNLDENFGAAISCPNCGAKMEW